MERDGKSTAAIQLARSFHIFYEEEAKKVNWNTQKNCKVDFDKLPIENKETMINTCEKVIQEYCIEPDDFKLKSSFESQQVKDFIKHLRTNRKQNKIIMVVTPNG